MSIHSKPPIPKSGTRDGSDPLVSGITPVVSGIPPVKVSVVDDDPRIGELVEKKLRRQAGFSFLASYLTAEDLFRLLPAQIPDVLMVDIILPRASGIEVVQWVTRHFPAVRMVVLSGSDDSNHVVQALEAGARGYLLKPVVLATLPALLHDIAAGEAVLAPKISGFLVNYFNRKGLVGDALRQLTPANARSSPTGPPAAPTKPAPTSSASPCPPTTITCSTFSRNSPSPPNARPLKN